MKNIGKMIIIGIIQGQICLEMVILCARNVEMSMDQNHHMRCIVNIYQEKLMVNHILLKD